MMDICFEWAINMHFVELGDKLTLMTYYLLSLCVFVLACAWFWYKLNKLFILTYD